AYASMTDSLASLNAAVLELSDRMLALIEEKAQRNLAEGATGERAEYARRAIACSRRARTQLHKGDAGLAVMAALWAAQFETLMDQRAVEPLMFAAGRSRKGASEGRKVANERKQTKAAQRKATIRARFKMLTATGQRDNPQAIEILKCEGYPTSTIYRD